MGEAVGSSGSPSLRLGTLVCAGLLSLSACSGSDRPSEGPEILVQAAIDARNAGDCYGYDSYFVDGDPDVRCRGPRQVVGAGSHVGSVTIEGNSATVELIDFYDCSAWHERPVAYTDVYRLILASDAWRIDEIDFGETTSDDCFT